MINSHLWLSDVNAIHHNLLHLHIIEDYFIVGAPSCLIIFFFSFLSSFFLKDMIELLFCQKWSIKCFSI